MSAATTTHDETSASRALTAPGRVALLRSGRSFMVVHLDLDSPVATVMLPSLVERWRGPLLLGLAAAAGAAAWLALACEMPLGHWFSLLLLALATTLVTRGARLLGLFAAPIRVLTTAGDRAFELRQRPDWRVIAFRCEVLDATRQRLGCIESVFGYWHVHVAHGGLRFQANDRELRWVDLWRRLLLANNLRQRPLAFTSADGAVVATAHAARMTFDAAAGTMPRDDATLLFAACLAAELAFTSQI